MFRHITTTGTFETDDPATFQLVLDSANAAEQAALKEIYSIRTLAERLKLSTRRTYDLLTEGRIRYTCAGKKNYRISEMAVREFLGDRLPTANP